MSEELDLPIPPDVQNRREFAAMEFLVCIFLSALMGVSDWTEEEIFGDVVWAARAKEEFPEELKDFVRQLSKRVADELY